MHAGFKQLKGMFQSGEKERTEQIRQNQSLVLTELSRFVQYMVNFGLSHQQSHDLLVSFCDYFQLEPSRSHLLLTEL